MLAWDPGLFLSLTLIQYQSLTTEYKYNIAFYNSCLIYVVYIVNMLKIYKSIIQMQ